MAKVKGENDQADVFLAPHQQAAARCVGMSEGCWSRGAPWLRPAELTPGLPLRLAGVATLRAACRAHPLWEARFSHVWAALRERATTPCVVVAVNVRPPIPISLASLGSLRGVVGWCRRSATR